jgi:hypothetical protein
MPDNDERDPLESWLNHEVRPLPPPPGTFELITRRARHRKLRRLTVTVGSAAVVAAAVAIVVPGVGPLHLTQPSATSAPLANRSSSSASAGQPKRTASPPPSATSSPIASSGAIIPPSGPVPGNFAPVSVTFVSAQTGWVIGQAGTPGDCATKYCTSIARTNNAGRSWVGVPAPMTGAAAGGAGVSGVRFLDGVQGWAFGPELWATHNAGNSWQQISTGGQRVTDLETAGDRAYALFASCSGASAAGFAADCTSYTLMTTSAGSDSWTPVGGATNGLTVGGNPTSATIALTSTTGYLLAPDGTLYSGALGSPWQRVGTVPCQPGAAPQANGLPANALLTLVNSTRLALACSGLSATSPPQIYTSSDSGATWTQQSVNGWGSTRPGSMTSLTATLSGALVLAATNGTYVLPAGAGGAQQTPGTGSTGAQPSTSSSATSQAWQAAPGGPAGGFGYVGMTTDTQGVALPANAGLHEIWMTFDGGLTWTAYPIS